MKHFFKHGVELFTLLLSLLACELNKTTSPITGYSGNIQCLDQEKAYQKEQEEEIMDDINDNLVSFQKHDEQFLVRTNTSYLYKYNQDKNDQELADEPITIIGFPGLTDTTGPTTLIEPLLGKYNINKSYSMITRYSENEDIDTHIKNTYRMLIEEDRLHDRLLLIPESFGTYPAYGVTQTHPELNIAGMISIHAPWEGVSSAAHIIKTYQKLQNLHLGWVVDSSLDHCQLSNYKIPKALATLGPDSPFLQKVKETLPEVKYPILSLAGKSTGRTGPYAYLYQLCKESKWKRLYSLGAGMVLGPTDHIIQEYELGNDGLVTTASALAATIPHKPSHFKGVLVDSTHFHHDFTSYPKLMQEVNGFMKTF